MICVPFVLGLYRKRVTVTFLILMYLLVLLTLEKLTFFCPLQANEGPEQESGHPETQGASGEEQERSADGGGAQARG